LEHLCFGHCFGFRASDFEFLIEKPEFSVSHYLGMSKEDMMSGFKGFPKEMIAFFKGLKKNNRKEWFEAHKDDY